MFVFSSIIKAAGSSKLAEVPTPLATAHTPDPATVVTTPKPTTETIKSIEQYEQMLKIIKAWDSRAVVIFRILQLLTSPTHSTPAVLEATPEG